MLRRSGCPWVPSVVATISALLTVPTFGQSDGRWKNGEEIYTKVCGYCHDFGVGPALKGRGYPPEAYAALVRNGLAGMPAFRQSEIDDASLKSLGEYLAKTEAPAPRQ